MIKKISGEIWKPVKFKGAHLLRNKYAVSSRGRAASYKEDVLLDGKILEGSVTSGYKTLNLHIDGSNGTLYLHREVARLFCKKKSPHQKYVIHINHDRSDNSARNLRWADQKEVNAHQQKSPRKIAYKKMQQARTKGLKLSAGQVKSIRAILGNPNRKLTHRQIAAKFDISPMTIYRIKSGENWSNIK